MYLYKFIFYAKYRRPVRVVELYAQTKSDAFSAVKDCYMAQNTKGYTIQRNKLDRNFVLCEMARNDYSMRIGACYITILCDGTVEVCDWNGNKSMFVDLLPAIDKFIAGVNGVEC